MGLGWNYSEVRAWEKIGLVGQAVLISPKPSLEISQYLLRQSFLPFNPH
jgi:hypothetical protein